MIREIQAKTMLATVRGEDDYFALKYNLNLYRGCEHQCIYCDSRSECYGIENFQDVLVKVNAVELLEKELPRKRVKGTIGFGSMSDPYGPVERHYELTRRALAVIARYGFAAHLITKSDMVLRDLDVLSEVNRVHAAVCFTLTTLDDDLARKLEPGAPPPSARLKAMAALAERGIATGTSLMPVLPFLEDNEENLLAIVHQTAEHGGTFLIPVMGMTMRDRQRAYFYEQLDRLFPGLRAKYEARYGENYSCGVPRAKELSRSVHEACTHLGLAYSMPKWSPPEAAKQLRLF